VAENLSTTFKVLGSDNIVYGPVDVATLCDWFRQGLVPRESWVFGIEGETWRRAFDLPEIAAEIAAGAASQQQEETAPPDWITVGMLRHIPILTVLTDDQIRELAGAMYFRPVKQFSTVVKMDQPGNSMFMILDGEVRVRQFVKEREKILATLPTGAFFGELAMLDHSPRSADVVSNLDSQLLELDGGALKRIATESPATTAAFLTAIVRAMARRIRRDNERWKGVMGYLEVLEVDLANFFAALMREIRQSSAAGPDTFIAVCDDGVAYGPAGAEDFRGWIEAGSVAPHNWVYSATADVWRKLGEMPEFVGIVPNSGAPAASGGFSKIPIEVLSHVKVLGSMTTDKLERVARILGIRTVKPLDVIVKQDAPGDSMFLILEGEVRVRQMIKGVEKTLTVIPAGEFFGELSLFDHSPRSADVVAVKTCKLIEVGGESLRALERSAPDVAAEFLFAVGKTMARRIRMDNHRWGKLIEHLQSIGVDVSQMLR
jgi:CRP-like cAMP-binding protein